MKKILALVLALCLVFALTACGASNDTAAEPETAAEAETEAAPEAAEAPAETVKIRVAASPTPHAEILAVAKEVLAAQGYEL